MKHLLVIVCAAGFIGSAARDLEAQHEGHQPGAATAGPANAACAEGARKALTLVDAANIRRDPAGSGREQIDRELAQLQRLVTATHAELFTCRAAVPAAVTTPPAAKSADPMAGMDHSKMNMGTPAAGARPAAPGAKPTDPMAGMDHSKMNMGAPAAGAKPPAAGTKPAARGAKPADPMAGMDHSTMNMGAPAAAAKPPAAGTKPAARGAKPADPMAGMDHSKMNMGTPASGAKPPAAGTEPAARGAKPADPMTEMDHSKMGAGDASSPKADAPSAGGGAGKLPVMMAERVADPGCPEKVGQAGAPKAVYARKVYYFCSVGARDEFRKDPAAYLKKHPR